ncbi:MAG TPA: aldolase/citrate lyase family protein, partial [Limnochordia bacterium]|nr:aldolase/citrate lyase family protein [Limnochordia bacterium]
FGDDYLDTINDRLVLLAQIESTEGLAAVDAILAVPGLSGILVGPEDLSRALGVPRARLFAAHDGTLAGLAQRARARGRCSSIWVRDLGEAARAIACGFDLVGLYPSAWVVRQQAKAGVEAFRAMADGRDAAQSQRGAGV